MTGFEIFLDVVAICFVFLLVGRDRNAPAVEVEVEAHAEVKEAIATVPDVDLPSIGELFQVADEERDAARAALGQVFADFPPHRPGRTRRARIEGLFDQAEELRQRTVVSDAALLTVATVAVNRLKGKG